NRSGLLRSAAIRPAAGLTLRSRLRRSLARARGAELPPTRGLLCAGSVPAGDNALAAGALSVWLRAPLLRRDAAGLRFLSSRAAAMGTLKPLRHAAEMPRRTGLLAVAFVGALLAAGAPARAADQPVATATIPPPSPAAAP